AELKETPVEKWKSLVDEKYSDFMRCFPVVTIDILAGRYCERAFRESFTKQLAARKTMAARLEAKKKSATGLEPMIEAQAEYAKRRYMYTTKHWCPREAR